MPPSLKRMPAGPAPPARRVSYNMLSRRRRSENDLRPELVDARGARAGDDAERSLIRHITSDGVPLRMVEGIEGLEAELEAHSFGNREVFKQPRVPVVDARRAQDAAPRSAQKTRVGLFERGLVKPTVDLADDASFADEVRAVCSLAVIQTTGVSRLDRHWEPLLERGDRVHLPTADDDVGHFRDIS